MSREKLREVLRRKSVKAGGVILAAALVFGGGVWVQQGSQTKAPELVTYVDQLGDIVIEGEETPLAAPKVKTTTKTKTKKKKIKLKAPSTRTYVEKGKTTTKVKTKKKTRGKGEKKTTTVTETTTNTSIVYEFKKGSNIKTQVTTTKTTIVTTTAAGDLNVKTGTKTITAAAAAPITAVPAAAAPTAAAAAPAAQPQQPAVQQVAVGAIAPKLDARVMNAFNKLGFTINVNAGVNYSGLFDARTRSITLKVADSTAYHELGHFLGFIAGNYDKTAQFQGIFNEEKALYTDYNAAYVLSNSSEYFAESFRNYTLDPAALQASRPKTYAAITEALSKVTDAQVNGIQAAYSAIWG